MTRAAGQNQEEAGFLVTQDLVVAPESAADVAQQGSDGLEAAGQVVADAFPDTDIRARQDWRDRELSALDAHLRARSERTA